MKQIFIFIVGLIGLVSCKSVAYNNLSYYDKLIKEKISDNCINICSAYLYNEYKDTLTNKVYELSTDNYGYTTIIIKNENYRNR